MKKMLLIPFIFLVFGSFGASNENQEMLQLKASLSKIEKKIDSDERFISLLERTNQMMGLWSNPYSFLVAVLSVLVTAGSIFFGVMIFIWDRKQKEQYKLAIENAQLEYRNAAQALHNEYKYFLDDSRKAITAVQNNGMEIISKLRVQQETKNPEEQAQIQKQIETLELKSASISSDLANILTTAAKPFKVNIDNTPWFHTCSVCKKSFAIHVEATAKNPMITCPECGNKEPVALSLKAPITSWRG